MPFDEGSLSGTLTPDSRWPDGDWRNTYFTPEKLADTLARVERLDACTYAADSRFFSFRRTTHRGEADYGRQISAIVLA